jgi:hypothetical protein
MGKRMPHQEKNTKGRSIQPLLFLPITATFFVNNTTSEEPEENTIKNHLDIIKKIDSILSKHEQQTTSATIVQSSPRIPLQPPSPVEPRSPLHRTPDHREVAWQPSLEPPQTTTQNIPEEFKTELSINPEFRFITSHEFLETITQPRPSSEDRIEVIDLAQLIGEKPTVHRPIDLTDLHAGTDDVDTSILTKDDPDDARHHNKIEVIDARTQKQKLYENILAASAKQAEQIDKKAQLYFLNSKDATDKKQKKLDIEQSYIPVDFDERSKEIREKQLKEEEEQRQQEEKILKQLQREHEKLEKLENKKTILEEKKQELKEKDKKTQKKETEQTETTKELKKQQKEQKRLQRLEIRKARIEARQRKKQEKQALKQKQKQQRLKQKTKAKTKQQKQKTKQTSLFKKEKQIPSLELNEDIKKVLLMTDALLGELPEDVLNRFVQSEDFELYEKVLSKYKIK